jgi:uncharacterized protein (TIGR04141 family)
MALVTVYRFADPGVARTDELANLLAPDHSFTEITLEKEFPGRLIVARSDPVEPDWVDYLRPLCRGSLEIGSRVSTGAVLLIWPYRNRNVLYAITWGTGHFLLKHDRLLRDLGLRAALNLLSPTKGQVSAWEAERFRALRTKRVGATTLISQIQASQKASVDSFPISLEGDQVRQVTGSPTNKDVWGATLTGGMSLHAKRSPAASELVGVCKRIEVAYKSADYKRYYGWLDKVAAVNDAPLTLEATTKVVEWLKSGKIEKIVVAPPDVVNWDDFDHFEFSAGRGQKKEVDDLSSELLLVFLKEHGLLSGLTVDAVTDHIKVIAVNDEGAQLASWPLKRCLSTELTLDKKKYVLDEGFLFAVERDYLASVNQYISAIPGSFISFPSSQLGQKEGAYNRQLSTALPAALFLDQKTVRRAGGTAIEVCDVALASKKLIHVKRGLASSGLSHLYSQGAVSADLLHMDDTFRNSVRAKITQSPEGSGANKVSQFGWLYNTPFVATECLVSFAVMTCSRKQLLATDLPFFSKVNLRLRCEDLRRMGFKYSLDLIPST